MYIAHRHETSNVLHVSVHHEAKCLKVFAESVSANCQISQVVRQRIPHQRASQPHRKPVGQMYSAFHMVQPAVIDRQIGNVAAM